jgi:hypothetical protein
VNKPVQELEQQLCADKEQLSSAVAVADLGTFLKQNKLLTVCHQN